MTEDEDRRPPIDLFKAIFEDTDSAESSSDESPDKAAAEVSCDPVVPSESVKPFQENYPETEVPHPTASIEVKTGQTLVCIMCLGEYLGN